MDFICECGTRQRQRTSSKLFIDKDVEKLGWRKINEKWVCPVCCNIKAKRDKIADTDCECCAHDLETVKARQQENLEEYGWFVHIIVDASNCPYECDVHTHGLKENFDHPDLQICIPVEPKVIHSFLIGFVEQIKKGKKYEVGVPVTDNRVFEKDLPVQFTWAKDNDRDVLRIIFSDKHKNLDKDTMELSDQWEGTFEKD